MFEEFYEMYETEEQEVVALINRCIGGGFNWKGNFWEMTVVTLGMVFCDTGKVSTKEERLEWPVTDEERNSEKGWERFQNEQICRLKIRRMKEEWAKDLVAWPWCISQVVKAHEDCPELQAVLDEYHKPVVIQDQVLGELTLDKDYDTFEGEIQWCGKDVLLSLEVNAESKPRNCEVRRSRYKKYTADKRDDNIKHVAYVHQYGAERICVSVRFSVAFVKVVVQFFEIFDTFGLMAENFDHFLTVHRFLNKAFLLAYRALKFNEIFCRTAAYLFGYKHHQHNARKNDKRHPNAVPQHYRKHRYNDDAALNKRRQ